jgi:hypothetical protein
MLENAAAMRVHNGPAFAHYRSRLLAAFGVVLDEPPASE